MYKKIIASGLIAASLTGILGCDSSQSQKPSRPSKQSVATVPANAYPSGIATGDMNGDGKLDILVSTYKGGDVQVNLLTNQSDGTYDVSRIATVPANAYPSGIATGDMNGDGKLDILVSTYKGGDVQAFVLLNKGDGTYSFQK